MDNLHVLYDFSEKEEHYDQWDEMIGTNNDLFHYLNMAPNFNMTFRLLGPFLPARRIYLQSDICNGFMNRQDLKNIILGNTSVIDRISKLVDSAANNSMMSKPSVELDCTEGNLSLSEFVSRRAIQDRTERRIKPNKNDNERSLKLQALKSFVHRCGNVRQWKPCMLINALVISSHESQAIGCIKLLSMSPEVVLKLHEECMNRFGNVKAKVNGLNAYDVTLTSTRGNVNNTVDRHGKIPRAEFGVMVEDRVTLSSLPYILPHENISHIVRDGIFDIKKVIQEHNKKKLNSMFGYFFKTSEFYKMPEEMMKPIIDEAKFLEEQKQYSLIDDYDRNSLPKEAFDDIEEITNPVMDMEI